MRHCVKAAAVTCTVALLFTACGGDDTPDAGPSPEPTETAVASEPVSTSEPTETAQPDPEPEATLSPDEEVITDYLAAREAFLAAYDPPDPDHPDLLDRYDGDALEGTQNGLRQLQADGHSLTGSFESHPVVLVRDPDAALIRDCYHELAQRVDTETREEIGDLVDEVRNVDTTLMLRDDTWVIVNRVPREEACTPGE